VRSLLACGAALSLGAGGRSVAASGGTACPALPEETSGPFPADGSDLNDRGSGPLGPRRWPGPEPAGPDGQGPGPGRLGPDRRSQVPNILAAPGIVRQDIRSSFDTSSTVAAGVPLRVELTLLDLSRSCQPLADSAVYLWNCNRDGDYSLYGRGIEHENYLRGVQFTDREGRSRQFSQRAIRAATPICTWRYSRRANARSTRPREFGPRNLRLRTRFALEYTRARQVTNEALRSSKGCCRVTIWCSPRARPPSSLYKPWSLPVTRGPHSPEARLSVFEPEGTARALTPSSRERRSYR
jgi:hypothetical protein